MQTLSPSQNQRKRLTVTIAKQNASTLSLSALFT